MKIPALYFQPNAPLSFSPVRALRCLDDSEDRSNGELLSTRGVMDKQTAVALIDSFRREFPKGIVAIEGAAPDWEPLPATGANLNQLFDSAK